MRITYEKALKDWKTLFEGIGPASDMTGGYVDQDDLDKLLKSPTKSTAKKCLINQIEYWFENGIDGDLETTSGRGASVEKLIEARDDIREISERYCHT
jgi:hypothetical protein